MRKSFNAKGMKIDVRDTIVRIVMIRVRTRAMVMVGATLTIGVQEIKTTLTRRAEGMVEVGTSMARPESKLIVSMPMVRIEDTTADIVGISIENTTIGILIPPEG